MLWSALQLPTAPTAPCTEAARRAVATWALQFTPRVALADGFDYPVGKPDATGYYKFRGFYPNGHLGEDWNGKGGGNSDLGDPVYSCADGIVVFSFDVRVGWGNCVIVRHAYRDLDGTIRQVDSLYAHLDRRTVRKDQLVRRGRQVGIGQSRPGKEVSRADQPADILQMIADIGLCGTN